MSRGDAASAVVDPALDGIGERQTPLSLIGRSAAVRALHNDIEAAVAAPCMLIEAEDGLDVADIAYDVHARDPRGGPFVVVACAGAEPAGVEEELFGRVEPVSTDLERIDARSALARAVGGSLLLMDVAELSAAAQARLARIARDGEVHVDDVVRRLDLRIIASVGTDAELVEGRLRRDLLRHLTRMRVVAPPLRRRAEDIPLLVEHLVALECQENGTPVKQVAAPALTLLAALPWRGNLSELREAVLRVVRQVTGDVIGLEDVLVHVRVDGSLVPQAPSGTLRQARQQFERDYIALVLRHHRGRVGEAARTLGIQRTNLYRKARQLGLALGRPGAES